MTRAQILLLIRIGMLSTLSAAGPVAVVVPTAPAYALELDADQLKCQGTIGKEATKFVAGLLKAHQKCRDADLKTPGTCAAPDPAMLAALDAKLRTGIAKKCNLGVARIASLGFPGPCPDGNPGDGFTLADLQDCIANSHTRAITGACIGGGNAGEACTTLADCPDTGPGTACRSVLALEYDPTLAPPLSAALLACQKTLAHESGKFLVAVLKAVQKNRDATNKGCGDAAKMAATIAKARVKTHAKIRGKCDDAMVAALAACEPDQTIVGGACTGGSNLGEPCTVLAECPDSGPGTACSGAAPCLTDTHQAVADDAATVPPGLIDVEYQCATPGTWPTTLEIAANGIDADLDVGWTGIAHDQTLPSNSRLTLSVSGCGSTGFPCGDCSLSGPIDNAGGAAVDNHRCTDKPWVHCSTDADCTSAGATGPCVYFFGAPLPLGAGGVPVCVLNQIDGAVTGTVNLDAGTSTATTPLKSRVHVTSLTASPCPRCEPTGCSGGPRTGEPCTVQGSTTFFGDVSLDCPPDLGGLNGTLFIDLVIGTGNRSVTLSAANPNCRGFGYTGQKCFCDTCNNAAADACMTNADCPLSGGNPGICGGARCLGGANAGAPCANGSVCPGGVCDRRPVPTQPNPCTDESAVPGDGALCTDTAPVGDNEGTCPEGPIYQVCSIETFRVCGNDTDCNPPACADCVPGQTCVTRPRPCFLDNGVIGGSVVVAGTVDAPCNGVAEPVLGALFCVAPVASDSVNTTAGLPGLGRLRLPVETVLKKP